MKKLWHHSALDDYLFWQQTDKKVVKRINTLIRSCEPTPFSGIVKPEPLKNEFSGYWSRRIDSTHRLIYKVKEDILIIIQCRFHY